MSEVNILELELQNKKPTDNNPVETFASRKYESLDCDYCETVIIYEDTDAVTICDTVEGQYIEYNAVACQECGSHNRTY